MIPQEFLVENGESVSLQTTQVLLRVRLTQGKQNWGYVLGVSAIGQTLANYASD